MDDAMAEEKGEGRLTSILVSLYLLRGRLRDTLHVAILCLTCAGCPPMQASVNGGNIA